MHALTPGGRKHFFVTLIAMRGPIVRAQLSNIDPFEFSSAHLWLA